MKDCVRMSLLARIREVNYKILFVYGLIVQSVIADKQIIFMGYYYFFYAKEPE